MGFEWMADPQAWITLVTLSAIEIVLGIDNLVFISIAVSKLPHTREKARKFGIAVACITRIALLLTLAWLAGLTPRPVPVFGPGISVRDLVLILGGVFLVVKGVMEIRDLIAGEEDAEDVNTKPLGSFGMVIAQIAVIDIVFSLDSVIAAVGMAQPDHDHGRGDPARGRRDAAGGDPARPFHRAQPDHQDAGAGVHRAGRCLP